MNLWIKFLSLLGGTHAVWCMSCKGQRKAKSVEHVKVETTKRTALRIIGRCTTCQAQTSSIVG